MRTVNDRSRPSLPRRRGRLAAIAAVALIAGMGLGPVVTDAWRPHPALAQTQAPPTSFAPLAQRLSPAVVNISTTRTAEAPRRGAPQMPQFPPGSPFERFFKDFFGRNGIPDLDRPSGPVRALGSGFIIDPAGYIVTNNHVIDGADQIKVILHDQGERDARLVGRDPRTDLALLKVEADKPLPFVSFGDSDRALVGDWVLAIGNPFGLGGTVTQGIISARARDIHAGPYDDFIQTDAAINQGNSGGPLFNLAGEVVGVNTAILSPSGGSVGVGFSIPSNIARPVIAELRDKGKISRGWIGVSIQSVDQEMAPALGLDRPRGALVAQILPDGPADKGKVQTGDVILSFDGREVASGRRLPQIVAETPIGKTVPVVVLRDRKEVKLSLKVAELVDREAAPESRVGQSGSTLGLTVAPVNAMTRERFGLDADTQGLVVIDVDGTSPAGERGLRPGDLITDVAGQPVSQPQDFAQRVKSARDKGERSILMRIVRGGDPRYMALPLTKATG